MPGTMKKKPTGGLKKLPTAVRNKMGYMNKGGAAKKKVIKVGVGKPYIRGEATIADTRETDTKLKALKRANNAVFKSKEYTKAQRKEMYDSILKTLKEQISNNTYFTKKKKK